MFHDMNTLNDKFVGQKSFLTTTDHHIIQQTCFWCHHLQMWSPLFTKLITNNYSKINYHPAWMFLSCCNIKEYNFLTVSIYSNFSKLYFKGKLSNIKPSVCSFVNELALWDYLLSIWFISSTILLLSVYVILVTNVWRQMIIIHWTSYFWKYCSFFMMRSLTISFPRQLNTRNLEFICFSSM